MRKGILCISLLVLFVHSFPLYARADKVMPSERVTSHVNVREGPSASTPIVGQLRVGEQAELVAPVPRWYQIRLADGTVGFVSKAWTTLVLENATEVSFQIHFLDVGTGDSAIIDVGETEIIIDGGDSTRVLYNFAVRTGIIDGPIELVVVTHADSDHWKGLTRLLGFDGQASQPFRVLEFWEPGYNRDCNPLTSYTNFINNMRNVPGISFRRPLETAHTPAVLGGAPAAFTLPSVPNVKLTLLHSDQNPPASNNDCPYRINNASIVLMVEISGFRFLFTGDANGKERDEAGTATPGHIEAKLLSLENAHPGTLKANVLKVPHHGSETASTQTFIDTVNPQFVIISASTKHHLPKETTVQRYRDGQRIILRTDINKENDRDHIVCFKGSDGLECNYLDIIQEQ